MRRLAVGLLIVGSLHAAGDETFAAAFLSGGDRDPLVSLGLRLVQAKRSYRVGEPIEAEMTIRVLSRDDYGVENSERDGSDALAFDPPSRPLTLASRLRREIHRPWSVSGEEASGGTLHRIRLDLNGLLDLSKPGEYRVRAATRRVHRGGASPSRLTLVSAPIEISIRRRDRAWEARQLARLQAQAKSGGAARERAMRRIGYLMSPEAATALVRLFGEERSGSPDPLLGSILLSQNKEDIAVALQLGLMAPDQAVGANYLRALALLQTLDLRGVDHNSVGQRMRAWQVAWSERLEAEATRLISQLPSKTPAARAGCLFGLLELSEAKTDWDALRPGFAQVFEYLPFEQQSAALERYWGRIRHPALRNHLLTLITADKDWYGPGDPSCKCAHPSDSMPGLALQRLSELDPAEARRIVLREARSKQPRISTHYLGLLPDATLPEIDPIVQERLHASASEGAVYRRRTSALLERYGTEAIYPEVRAIESSRAAADACSAEPALLAYYFRVDRAYGLGRVVAAISPGAFETDPCRMKLLTEVWALEQDEELERLALGLLGDPSPGVVGDAAKWLGGRDWPHPGRHADALWRRLEAFHAEWSGREEELRELDRSEDEYARPSRVAEGIRRGLMLVTGPGDVRRLRRLSLAEEVR